MLNLSLPMELSQWSPGKSSCTRQRPGPRMWSCQRLPEASKPLISGVESKRAPRSGRRREERPQGCPGQRTGAGHGWVSSRQAPDSIPRTGNVSVAVEPPWPSRHWKLPGAGFPGGSRECRLCFQPGLCTELLLGPRNSKPKFPSSFWGFLCSPEALAGVSTGLGRTGVTQPCRS